MKWFGYILIVISIFLIGCITMPLETTETTPIIKQGETRIYDSSDEFTGIRAIEIQIVLDQTLKILPRFAFSNDGNEFYFICFYYQGSSWYFFDNIYFIVDGQNSTQKVFETERDVISGTVTEWFCISSTLSFIQEISNAQEVKMKISGSKGNKIFELDNSQKDKIKDFLTYLNENL